MKERPILFSGAMVRAIMDGSKSQTRRIFKLPKWAHPNDKGADIAGDTPAICHQLSGCLCDVPCPYGSGGDRIWVKETFAIHPEVECDTIYRANRGGDYQGAAQGDFTWKPSIFMPRHRSRITLEITGIRVERLQEISAADAIAEGIEVAEITHEYAMDGRGKTGRKKIHYKFYGKELERLKQQTSNPVWSYQTLWNSINLKPNPIYITGEDGKKRIISYECFPWSDEDFDVAYPGVRTTGLFRGKPIVVTANPWVWIIEFKQL